MDNNENYKIQNKKSYINMALYLAIPVLIVSAIMSYFRKHVDLVRGVRISGTYVDSTIALVLSIIVAELIYFVLLFLIKRIIAAYTKQNKIKLSAKAYTIVLIILAVTVIGGFYFLFPRSSSERGGNGTTTCKNCGRQASLTSGYCSTCYEGFSDWYNDTYVNGK